MKDIARRLGTTFKNYDLPIDPEEYVSQFKPFLMDVVYEWSKGANFSKVLGMTDIFEGTVSLFALSSSPNGFWNHVPFEQLSF